MLFYNWYSGCGIQWENGKNHFLTDYRMLHNIDPKDLIFLTKKNKMNEFKTKFFIPKCVKQDSFRTENGRSLEEDLLFQLER